MDVDRRGSLSRHFRALFHSGTMTGLTDGQLLELFASRDGASAELAFTALVERHGPMVRRVCRRLMGGAHDADDAFHATFLILARKAAAIRRRDSIGPWLFGVALKVARCDQAAANRRRAREHRFGVRLLRERVGAVNEDLDRSELSRVVLEEVGRLPERYRAAVVLCDLEALGYEEAARLLGCPVGTVKSRQARGRDRLRDRLSRRGFAPALTVSASMLWSQSSQAAVSAALADSTARLAMAVRMAQALAAGTVPVAVEALVTGVLRTMFLMKMKLTGMIAVLAAGAIAAGGIVHAYQAVASEQPPARAIEGDKKVPASVGVSDAGLLIVTGTILMPDGKPAVGATLTSISESDEISAVAKTEVDGRFRVEGLFENGARLYARSSDGIQQAVLVVSADAARTAFGSPVELRLSKSVDHRVTVLAEGRPVEGARVAASGNDFKVDGVTGRDGQVVLRLPAGKQLNELVAWHPVLGVNGFRNLENGLKGDSTPLSLRPPGPHQIRVIDTEGKPVRDLDLEISLQTEDSDWIISKNIEAARVSTDAEGIAKVAWLPREKLKYVEVGVLSRGWKVDETDREQISEGVTTLRVRREMEVRGRFEMPAGANPEGILVSGFGFGPTSNGDIPYARVRRDGTFTLRVPSEHGYVLGISDTQWASDPWTGLILWQDSSKPADITLNVYPATPIVARVTRGPRHEPVVDAWVEVECKCEVKWIDAKGEKQSGGTGTRTWLKTDAKGVARAGVGRGKQQFRVASGLWDETREVNVTSDKPIEIEFHRPWTGQRQVKARLMLGGEPYKPSGSLVARAWSPQVQRLPLEFEPTVHPDGTLEVSFDAPSLSLYVLDREKQRAGFARVGLEGEAVDLNMESMAGYGGTVLDPNDRPMPDQTLQIFVKGSRYEAISAQQTDRMGRFRFPSVPANVPLEVKVQNIESGEPRYFLFDRERLFEPGESRLEDRLKPHRIEDPAPIAQKPVPLAESVGKICRNAGSTGLRGLVVLQGDQSQDVVQTVDRWFDDEKVRSILSYLPLRLKSDQWKSEAAIVAEFGWPVPGAGEIALVVLDGDRKTIAAKILSTSGGPAAAQSAGVTFLDEHRPLIRDARKVLADASREARSSGRRVWLIHSGPRCAPCFTLARWIKDHHSILEADYVVVELIDIVDDHVQEAIAGLPEKEGDGIPWFAFTEADGTILATSSGPLGNIGFPSSVEGVRHFRQMLDLTARRLRPADLDGLIKSLSPER